MSFLLAPLGVALMVAAISYLLFFRAARRDAAPTPPASLVFRGVAYSVAGVALALALYPFGPWIRRRCRPRPFPCPAKPQAESAGRPSSADRILSLPPALPPVLLVHGLYHNVTAWTLYRRWLTAAGFTRVYCHGYSSWRTDFGLLVDELDEAVRDLVAAHPGERPLLMGHSLGGLLIRGWLAEAANQHLVAGAVTLGTPHQGSCLARLGAGRLARSLAFRGALIRNLEASEAPAEIPCVALYSPIDNMVVPQEGLHVTTPGWTLRASPAVSHIWMLWDKGTARLAIESLRQLAARQTARKQECAAEDERVDGSNVVCPCCASPADGAAGHPEKMREARNDDGAERAADRKDPGYSRA
ncbi:MAG TPA: alpha/beta fold hydrolase [Nitratidesulfovibrio sp.]|nr:alpha/beta fold hydrolase [Nitratidesulfovibrio sp.]